MVLKRWMSWILVLALLLPGVEAVNAMTAARPAPQAAACLSVAFLADVTIPDYSAMEAGKSFVKPGACATMAVAPGPKRQAHFSDGDKLGAPASVAVGALAVGEKTDISITLKAPTANGTYQGAWRLSDDKGAAFGPRLTTLIKVGAGRTPAATATPKSASGTATPTSAACLNAGYLADVTIPDYSAVEAGKGFTKTWRVRNNGSCAWPADTQLTFVSGEQLGAAAKVTVGAVDAGVTKEISVEMKAPTANGSYKGVWQLASGAVFGTKLTVVIKVGAGSSAPATTGATPSTGASTPSAACLNASYVADVTIPDYTTFEPARSS
jgi:methionine-rich copper-binding protein CopC